MTGESLQARIGRVALCRSLARSPQSSKACSVANGGLKRLRSRLKNPTMSSPHTRERRRLSLKSRSPLAGRGLPQMGQLHLPLDENEQGRELSKSVFDSLTLAQQ